MMKRYDIAINEYKNGTVHVYMDEAVGGEYVTHQDAEQAIAAAVAAAVSAEQKRVWHEITARISGGGYDDHPVDELSRLRRDLFPDGEPQQ